MEENQNNLPDTSIQPTEETIIPVDAPVKNPAGTGKKVAAFIFFGFTILFFLIFCASSIFTLSIMLGNIDDIGEAIGAIFTIILSLPAVIISAIPTLVFNILSLTLFKGIYRREDAHPILYKVFYIISVILLVLMLVLAVIDAIIFIAK